MKNYKANGKKGEEGRELNGKERQCERAHLAQGVRYVQAAWGTSWG